MTIRSAMTYRPATREECEGFQMLAFGLCCTTCEWAGEKCPFERNDATRSDSAYPTAESARSSASILQHVA